MAATDISSGTLRHRNVAGSGKKAQDNGAANGEPEKLKTLVAGTAPPPAGSERDYQVVFFFITALAFLTRFWGISHPNEVVFDEVHFGKVRL